MLRARWRLATRETKRERGRDRESTRNSQESRMTWENRGDLPVSTRLASFVPSNGRSHNSSGSARGSFLHIPATHIPGQGRDDQIHGKDRSIGSHNCPRADRYLIVPFRFATRSANPCVYFDGFCHYPIYFTFTTLYECWNRLPLPVNYCAVSD